MNDRCFQQPAPPPVYSLRTRMHDKSTRQRRTPLELSLVMLIKPCRRCGTSNISVMSLKMFTFQGDASTAPRDV